MVSFEVPCRTRAMEFYQGFAVTSTGILSNIGMSSFIWDDGVSMLLNVGECYKRTSNSSRLSTLMRAVGGVCTLGVESSPDMVIVSLSPWKGMFSTSYALGVGGDGGIDIGGGVIASLEDEPFSSVFCFFYEGSTSMALFSFFYFHL